MSQLLQPLTFPLHGSRLIEASAGTGKTWTIAALYVRLVLGHGAEHGYQRPLLPADILVMTFTRAATRELSNRVRERLVEAAAYFRSGAAGEDSYLDALLDGQAGESERQQAAHRLMLAAETMDEAAIFTIDAWCQRMLREHAFDSGSLFDEELVTDEAALFEDAAHDYWRQHVYPLGAQALEPLLACWPDANALKGSVRELVARAASLAEDMEHPPGTESLVAMITRLQRHQRSALLTLKEGWSERANRMEQWIAEQRAMAPKCFNGVKMKPESVAAWFDALRAWAQDDYRVLPALNATAWNRLTTDGLMDARAKGFMPAIPDDFDAVATLKQALDGIEPLQFSLQRHAATAIAARMELLKRTARQFGFADMLERLRVALQGPNGEALRQRIIAQYPVAMVDEFQDTAPSQYQIFDLLYRVKDNVAELGLFLIGDPKQSIYGFRGADIHSYLSARRATTGRHYQLGTNYRSTGPLVAAVNQVFLHAEGHAGRDGFARGAFRFRAVGGRSNLPADNPLPFDAVAAKGRSETLVQASGPLAAMQVACCAYDDMKKDGYRDYFAHHCAEHITALLNDARAGFDGPDGFKRLQPADIAVLVRDRKEASAIRRALQRRKVASVYLSDKDSVLDSEEAADVLRWLTALASPLDGGLARAAFATRTAGLPLAELARLSSDELAWEQRVDQLKALHGVWQRQGVLAMLRRFIHELQLPSALLAQVGGERRLTNLLHLAELLQAASRQLDGEQALIRWLAEQIADGGDGGDERVLRLESDAELVKVVTVHKSKGLEYPLVYLPFAVSARKAERRNRSYFEYTEVVAAVGAGAGSDPGVRRVIDLALTEAALEAVEDARLAEDLRLLYVALTRPRHFLWLGVAALAARKAGANTLHESALGYLLTGGVALPAAELAARWTALKGDCAAIGVQVLEDGPGADRITMLEREEVRPPLVPALQYSGRFERDWAVGSFTSLARQTARPGAGAALADDLMEGWDVRANNVLSAQGSAQGSSLSSAPNPGNASDNSGVVAARVPRSAAQEKLLEATVVTAPVLAVARVDDAPWHRFPRGSMPGNFLHEQLEWMGHEGFATIADPQFDARLLRRIERGGWGNRQDDALAWLRAIAETPLPPLGAPLTALQSVLPEMEFWFPSERLSSGALDRLCRRHLLVEALTEPLRGELPRPALPERQLHGMLKGYMDLVFEHEGRYWVLDYKSNALGGNDAAYHGQALARGMAEHRYDIQGAIYLLALHRLLRARLGDAYDPQRQLGGAIFFFLRGIGHAETRGCCVLPPDLALLDAMDALFNDAPAAAQQVHA